MSGFPLRWRGPASALASGILLMASRDLGPFGPLVLVAPVPLLLYALGSDRVWRVAGWSFVAGLLARLSLVVAYLDVFPAPVLVLWMTALPLWFAGIVLAARWTARNGPLWMGLFGYPLFTTASEFLFNSLSPHGSFGSLGYSLTELLPLLQVASLGGVAALTFLAAFVPMALVLLLRAPCRWRTIAVLAVIPVAAAVVFGVIRLSNGYDGHKRVALASIDSLQDDELSAEDRALANASAYGGLARALAEDRPDLILFPEKSLIRMPGWSDIGVPLQDASNGIGIPIVAGFDETRADGRHDNVAIVYAPRQAPQRYSKRRLIPGLEAEFNPGTESLAIGEVGVAICKDLDFAPMIRDYGRRGIRLMLVPAWDFRSDTDLHARMALVRGVENGFAVARAAADGVLTVSDAYGRMLAERPTTRDRPITLVTDIGLTSTRTIYNRIGDLFGWLTVIGAVLLVAPRRSVG